MTKQKLSKACSLLRKVLYHRLAAWDASYKAESILDQDIDTDGEDISCELANYETADEAIRIPDERILEIFGVEVTQTKSAAKRPKGAKQ